MIEGHAGASGTLWGFMEEMKRAKELVSKGERQGV